MYTAPYHAEIAAVAEAGIYWRRRHPKKVTAAWLILRLHDEAGSTSWLDERSSSQLHRVNGVLGV